MYCDSHLSQMADSHKKLRGLGMHKANDLEDYLCKKIPRYVRSSLPAAKSSHDGTSALCDSFTTEDLPI